MPPSWVAVRKLAVLTIVAGVMVSERGPRAQTTVPEAVSPEAPQYETTVTATTPLHGSGLPADHVPANVQTATGASISRSQSLDVSQYMNGELGSVHVNQVQDNPLQPDLQYRGFLASPLLGAPQGLAVYLDGVRLNEVFGDTVNWDLVPQNAIRTLNLMPGSNPLFGLNTLGGALTLETKTGFSDPGAEVRLAGGSFDRRLANVQLGLHGERLAAFVSADVFKEDGWRPFSPSSVARALLAASYENAPTGTAVDLTLVAAESDLTGNGPAPVQLLAAEPGAIFTHPDETSNRMQLATLRGERVLAKHARLSGLTYVRHNNTRTLNGDQGRWAACQDPAQSTLLCAGGEDGGQTLFHDAAGQTVPFDPIHPYDGAENSTATSQLGYGASTQLALDAPLASRENHLFLGATANEGRARFTSQSALARLSATRGTLPAGIVDGDSLVDVESVTRTLGVYASDTFAVARPLFLTASARANISALSLRDQRGTALDGEHRFERLNPALGASFQPRPELGVFGGYAESTRAPTALELTCASATDPCRLPNGFISDPALAEVVARTFELGVRGQAAGARGRLAYDLAAFRTTIDNDILFVSAGPVASQGFFDNVGRTRRQGVEAGLSARGRLGARAGRLELALHYTWLDATFEASFDEPAPHHPDAVAGALTVPAGARLPATPRHLGKATATWIWAERLAVGANLVANSSQFLRGDEANLLAPLGGFVVLDLRASLDLSRAVSVFVKVSNLLDAHLSTFGTLGDATVVLGPAYDDPRFQSPGAPRAAWAGLALRE